MIAFSQTENWGPPIHGKYGKENPFLVSTKAPQHKVSITLGGNYFYPHLQMKKIKPRLNKLFK